jgi:site-specific DNA-methyltransferase (adenine-specific)
MGVSRRLVQQAKGLKAEAPEVFEKVRRGEIKIGTALREEGLLPSKKSDVPVSEQIQWKDTQATAFPNNLEPLPFMSATKSFPSVKIGDFVTLFHGDMFDVLPLIDIEFNLACCDLPYATKTFGRCTDRPWDSPVPLDKFWTEFERCMKPNAVIFHFCNMRLAHDLIHTNISGFRQDIVFHKENSKTGHLWSRYRTLVNHENMLIFIRKGKFTQATYQAQKVPGGRAGIRKIAPKSGGVYRPTKEYVSYSDGLKHPGSVWSFPHDRGAGNRDQLHETQKPVALLRQIIRSYSKPGDIIIDPCFGSGTTIVAAMLEGRRVVGIEKKKSYFNKAVGRATETYNALQQGIISSTASTSVKRIFHGQEVEINLGPHSWHDFTEWSEEINYPV